MPAKKAKAKAKTKASASKQRAARVAIWIEAMVTNGGNATQAAVSAGYKPGDAAKKAGYRLSTDVHVAKALEARRAEALAKAQEITGISVERTLKELGRIAYFDVRRLYREDGSLKPIHEWDDDCAAAVAAIDQVEEFAGKGEDRALIGYTKKVRVFDKNSAIEKAMKHLGLFEKDNRQKTDPVAELLAAIQERGSGLPIKA